MRTLILVSLFYSIFGISYAQGQKAFMNSNHELVFHGKSYKRDFFSQAYQSYNNEELFADNPTALNHYKDHVYKAKWASALLWSGTIAATTYGFKKSEDLKWGTFWTIFATGWLGHFFLKRSSQNSLVKAINIYNGSSSDMAKFNKNIMFLPVLKAERAENFQTGLALQLIF